MSDSDDYQTVFEMYEMILKEAKTAIKEDIGDYTAGTKDMKKYVSGHINVLFREHIDDLQDQGLSRSKIDDLKVRMNAELCPKVAAKKKRSRKKRSYRKTKRRSRSRRNR